MLRKMKPNHEKHPTTFRELKRYLVEYGGRDCFNKAFGSVWMLTMEGNWKYAARCLPELELEEYLKISLKY